MELKEYGKKLNIDSFSKLENLLKGFLPEEYKKFMLEHNGGRPMRRLAFSFMEYDPEMNESFENELDIYSFNKLEDIPFFYDNLFSSELIPEQYCLCIEQIYREELDNEIVTVYNFQVDEYHTYFVGERGIWVHNSKCGGSYKSLKKDKNGKMYDKEEVHHMPAKKSSTLSEGDGPAIRMDKSDHRRTASCGRSKKHKHIELSRKN